MDETFPLLLLMGQKNETLVAIHDTNDGTNNHSPPPHHHHHHHHHPKQKRQRTRRITAAYRRHRYETRKQLFACALAACSGFADVLCYHSFGCYGNMMTGNTIKLMDHLAAGRWSEALYPASLVPAYVVGAALCTYLSKLDLTRLGWGGPSARAFSHLQPPRRLRSPQQISVLRVVAVGCVVLFLAGEVFGSCLEWWWWWWWWWAPHDNSESPTSTATTITTMTTTDQRWRLPFFACAFGLLNAATLAAIHLVTNAVTGHWITVGLGVADDLPILLNRQSSYHHHGTEDGDNDGDDGSNNNDLNATIKAPTTQPPIEPPSDETLPPTEKQKQWKSSMFVAASFLGSIILTSIFYNECLRQVEHHPHWPLALLFRFSPPMGVLFSVLYTVLLYWYTLPPPFLQGFSSRVDLTDMLMDHEDDEQHEESDGPCL